MSVTLVIPNWNGMEHLPVCLSSLERQVVAPAATIVVDNGSTDDSIAYIRAHHPGIMVILFNQNRGFAAAVNAGIRAAKSEFIALLNNDTELEPRWLEALTDGLRRHPEAGSVTGKMLDFQRRTIVDGAGDVLSRGYAPVTRGAGEPDDGRFADEGPVFGACAGAALYRRAMLDDIGLFDEDFVSYYEDLDLAFRAQLAGYACWYIPAAVCFHKRGATAARLRAYPVRMQERNLTLLHAKDLPLSLMLAAFPVIAASRTRRIVRLIRAGAGMASLAGCLEGLRLLPRILRKRVAVQRLRRVTLASLRAFAGKGTP